jgi:hypothetical protein
MFMITLLCKDCNVPQFNGLHCLPGDRKIWSERTFLFSGQPRVKRTSEKMQEECREKSARYILIGYSLLFYKHEKSLSGPLIHILNYFVQLSNCSDIQGQIRKRLCGVDETVDKILYKRDSHYFNNENTYKIKFS